MKHKASWQHPSAARDTRGNGTNQLLAHPVCSPGVTMSLERLGVRRCNMAELEEIRAVIGDGSKQPFTGFAKS